MNSIVEFFKKETVLCCSGILAIISMFFIMPDSKYIEYIDLKVITLLFCLMGVVAGIRKAGFFDKMSSFMISKAKDIKHISIILVMLCFFSAMFITNDVALITFVPLTIAVMGKKYKDRVVFIIVMQTIAANLGSMATPVGNPQNLYLYSYYNMDISEFFSIVIPISILSFVIIFIVMIFKKGEKIDYNNINDISVNNKDLLIYVVFFIICLLTVFNIINYKIMFGIVLLGFIIYDRSIIKEIDFNLLITFIFFFIFVGNMGRIEIVKNTVNSLITGKELISSILISQVISNVPASLMLSGFTNNSKALLQGVNIGGLGTLVASLASLISFKIYTQSEDSNKVLYIKKFTLYNIVFLVIIGIFTYIFF